MLTTKERQINNTFQIREDLKGLETRKSFYFSSAKSRPPLRAQLPGRVKVFSEEEVFLYKIRKYKEEGL